MSQTEFYLQDAVKAFTVLAADRALQDRAIESCQQSLQNCMLEERELGLQALGGWSLEEIELHFEKCSLVFSHKQIEYPFIDTQIGLYIKDVDGGWSDRLISIGSYRLLTLLDGTIDDDYLVILTEKS